MGEVRKSKRPLFVSPPAAGAAKWLRRAVVAIVTLLPLVVFPGIERPFSTPKIFLLGGFVVIGGICAVGVGRLSWPVLPLGFRLSLIAWPSALVLSALLGEFVSQEALWLSLFSLGWFLLVVALRPKAVHIATGLVLSCVVVGAIALLQYLGYDPFRLFGWTAPLYGSPRMRVFGTLGNPNFVAAMLVAGLPLSAALGRILKHQILFSLVIALEGLAVFATGSRAAILAVGAVVLWLGAVGQVARWQMIAVGALVIIALLAFAPSRSLKTTLEGRFYIWRVTVSHLLERPLFGFGPGAFEPKYIQWETLYWREGRGSADQREFAALQKHAHNDYLETLVNSGIAGLLSFLFLLGSFFVFAFRQAKAGAGGLLDGASAGVIALAAVAMVDFPLCRPTELFFFWTLMALVYLESSFSTAVRGMKTIDKHALNKEVLC